jgi:hypothetical protein
MLGSFSETANREFIRHQFDTFKTYPGPVNRADTAFRGNAVGIQAKNPAIVSLRSRRAVRNALPVARRSIDWGAGALEYAKGVSAAGVRNGCEPLLRWLGLV